MPLKGNVVFSFLLLATQNGAQQMYKSYKSWSAGDSVMTLAEQLGHVYRRPRRRNQNSEDPELGLTGALDRMQGTEKRGVG